MRKVLSFLIVALLLLSMQCSIVANANEYNGYGNEWIYDEAQVISDETEAYIKNLNESVFVNYANKPQLAIMIVNNLPYNMDQYKLDMFNDYGVGTATENCGMLFIFAINDREYGFEIGDGFIHGSLLRADLETDFVTEEMKSYLRAENYDMAVKMIIQYIERLMADQENGVYAEKEANKLASDKNKAKMIDSMILAIGTITYTDDCEKAIEAARKEYSKLPDYAKEFVEYYDSLVLAEQTYKELRQEAQAETLQKIGLVLCIMFPIVGVVILCVSLFKKKMRKNKIDELCGKYSKHINLAGMSADAVKEHIDNYYSTEYSLEDLEYKFLKILYELYINKQIAFLKNASNLTYNLNVYIDELHRVNTYSNFEQYRLYDLAKIVNYVDKKEHRKEELRTLNIQKVNDFLDANRNRVVDYKLWIKLRSDLHDNFDNFTFEVCDAQLEKRFSEKLDALGFEKEFERFLNENQDKIGRDFSRSKLYMEMCSTNSYRNYHYGNRMDRIWMIHMLMNHQERQKQNRLEREAAEKRHREAQRRAQQQSINRRNSSYGSSFSGGHSSSGGFKGGW